MPQRGRLQQREFGMARESALTKSGVFSNDIRIRPDCVEFLRRLGTALMRVTAERK
jgi:hypothetical protein